jgi:cytoskeletal protein RodZ
LREKLRDSTSGEDEFKSNSPLGGILALALVIVIAIGGFMLWGSMAKKTKLEAAAKAKADSTAAAAVTASREDSLARVAHADSLARAASDTTKTASASTRSKTATSGKSASGAAAGKTAGSTSSAGAKTGTASKGASPSASAAASKTHAPKSGGAAGGGATPPAGGSSSGDASASGGDASAEPAEHSASGFGIVVGSYIFEDKANTERDRLAGATGLPGMVKQATEEGSTVYQVILGKFTSKSQAEKKANALVQTNVVREARVIARPKG